MSCPLGFANVSKQVKERGRELRSSNNHRVREDLMLKMKRKREGSPEQVFACARKKEKRHEHA